MARRAREQLTCSACEWSGITTHGRVRWAVFIASSLAVVVLLALELVGALHLGEELLPLALLIMLASIGLRLLIRGDRCPRCRAPAVVVKARR